MAGDSTPRPTTQDRGADGRESFKMFTYDGSIGNSFMVKPVLMFTSTGVAVISVVFIPAKENRNKTASNKIAENKTKLLKVLMF